MSWVLWWLCFQNSKVPPLKRKALAKNDQNLPPPIGRRNLQQNVLPYLHPPKFLGEIQIKKNFTDCITNHMVIQEIVIKRKDFVRCRVICATKSVPILLPITWAARTPDAASLLGAWATTAVVFTAEDGPEIAGTVGSGEAPGICCVSLVVKSKFLN